MSRITKWTTRSLAAAAVLAGSMTGLAAPAQAYDRGHCNWLFGAANVAGVDTVRVDGGAVDFGDGFHLGGWPQDNAVVCWSVDGRVALAGRVYADNWRENISVYAKVSFYRGGVEGSVKTYGTTGKEGASAPVNRVSGAGNHSRVRIRLYKACWSEDFGPCSQDTLLHTSNRYR